MSKEYTCLGMMSGTSGDGVDASIIQSNGLDHFTVIKEKYYEYDRDLFKEFHNLKKKINSLNDLKKFSSSIKKLENNITIFHAKAVKDIRLHRNPILFQILNLMCSYANNKTQQLFVSQARLAMITGKHQSTISKQIHLLVNLGYIDILKTGSPWSYSRVKTSRYKIIWK